MVGPADMGEATAPAEAGAGLRWLRRVLASVVALAMFAMTAVTFVDVVGRYLLARPVPGASELVQVLMAVLIGAALPLVSMGRSHITMALFTERLKGQARRRLDALLHAAGAVVLGFLAWRLADQAVSLADSRAATLFLDIPTAPFAGLLAALLALTALVEALHAWRRLHMPAKTPA